MNKNVIELKQVNMEFVKNSEKINSLKEYFIKGIKGKIKKVTFMALEDINITIQRGEKIGIIGPNGAGKSTMLKIIAGVYKPTLGTVVVNGSVAPLLELGAGFDPEITGHENIFLNGAILGKTKKELLEKYDEIVEFSGLEDFIYTPLKNYSSGMRARLGFSIATQINPEILIVDEVLGVGDESFKRKSGQKIKELISGGTTVLLVSHNLAQIRELTDKVLWLRHGKIVRFGEANSVCDEYLEFIDNKNNPGKVNLKSK